MNKFKAYSKTKCVIHLIHSRVNNNHDPSVINSVITSKYAVLWEMMKEGDLVEDLDTSGYRSMGRFIVKKDRVGKLYVDSLHTDYDDYGTVPPEFETITKFPIGYYDNWIINDSFHVGEEHKSYWHSDNCYMWLNTIKLHLDNLTPDKIKIKKCGNEYYVHTVVEYKGVKYLLYNECSRKYGPTPFTSSKLKDEFIELFDYPVFNGYDKCYLKTTDVLTKILTKNGIDKENVMLLFKD